MDAKLTSAGCWKNPSCRHKCIGIAIPDLDISIVLWRYKARPGFSELGEATFPVVQLGSSEENAVSGGVVLVILGKEIPPYRSMCSDHSPEVIWGLLYNPSHFYCADNCHDGRRGVNQQFVSFNQIGDSFP